MKTLSRRRMAVYKGLPALTQDFLTSWTVALSRFDESDTKVLANSFQLHLFIDDVEVDLLLDRSIPADSNEWKWKWKENKTIITPSIVDEFEMKSRAILICFAYSITDGAVQHLLCESSQFFEMSKQALTGSHSCFKANVTNSNTNKSHQNNPKRSIWIRISACNQLNSWNENKTFSHRKDQSNCDLCSFGWVNSIYRTRLLCISSMHKVGSGRCI